MIEEQQELPTDEVTALIASIDMYRKEIERESGLEASRNYALRRLQLVLLKEQEATQVHGSSPARLATAEALTIEIKRVGALARSESQRPAQGRDRPNQQPQHFRQDAQRHPPKSRGRRTMGRSTTGR